eukprot:gene14652-biopygen585
MGRAAAPPLSPPHAVDYERHGRGRGKHSAGHPNALTSPHGMCAARAFCALVQQPPPRLGSKTRPEQRGVQPTHDKHGVLDK